MYAFFKMALDYLLKVFTIYSVTIQEMTEKGHRRHEQGNTGEARRDRLEPGRGISGKN
jgi:hypothetical protein